MARGATIYGTGNAFVGLNRGDWTGISHIDFGTGAKSITIEAGSVNGAVIKVSIGRQTGTTLAFVTIPKTNDNFKFTKITATVKNAEGVKNVFFVASNDVVLKAFKFNK